MDWRDKNMAEYHVRMSNGATYILEKEKGKEYAEAIAAATTPLILVNTESGFSYINPAHVLEIRVMD